MIAGHSKAKIFKQGGWKMFKLIEKFPVTPSDEESMDLCGSFWNDHGTTVTFLSKGFL